MAKVPVFMAGSLQPKNVTFLTTEESDSDDEDIYVEEFFDSDSDDEVITPQDNPIFNETEEGDGSDDDFGATLAFNRARAAPANSS